MAEASFDLDRFITAQAGIYETAVTELRDGRKRSHWMWFIFPQIAGLGYSATAKRFAIRSTGEARAYLAHPVLGPRLIASTKTLLQIRHRTASQIFGYPDDLKLRSSMTLFAAVAEPGNPFAKVLAQYFDGEADGNTEQLIADQ